MAQYSIEHVCGHTRTAHIIGPGSRRESRAQWLAGTLCNSCWQEGRDRGRAEQSERDAAANRVAGLPALAGSPKQVDWAETIRAEQLGMLDRERDVLTRRLGLGTHGAAESESDGALEAVETARAALSEIAESRWFIDHKTWGVGALARLAARGQLRPRTAEHKASGFDPFGLNSVSFPADEVERRTVGERRVLRLVRSRWEGCSVLHPPSMAEEAPDGSVVMRFGGDWSINVDDGARTRSVSAEDFYLDRVNRRAEPADRHFWGPPPYAAGEWNEFDVPEGEVSEREVKGRPLAVVRLACSRWEGLHFEHPARLVRRHRAGFVTVRFGPRWEFKVLGGARMLRVSGQQMHGDRVAPLPQPGESLAVEQKTWHTVTFHPSRSVRGRDGDTWLARFPLDAEWPEALVFHPKRMCRLLEDGYIAWRFHEDWRFRVRTSDSDTVELSADEFLAATSRWADSAPVLGTFTRVPEHLDPAAEIAIPAELLEDDPFADEEG